MYNFKTSAAKIIYNGREFGVKVALNPTTNKLEVNSKRDDWVIKSLTRKIKTYNSHVDKGF